MDALNVPLYWKDCPNISTDLIDDTFVVFKTPLDYNYDEKLDPESIFRPETVFEICDNNNINLGLWVDLSNPNTFYSSDEITEFDCSYFKLRCSGYKETPNVQNVLNFNKIVRNFKRKNPTKHVGVHCTLGFNQTGYMIVSYLVEIKQYNLYEALNLFQKVRHPGIYQQQFVNELSKTYCRFPEWIRTTQPCTKIDLENLPKDDYKKIICMKGVTQCMDPKMCKELRNIIQKMCQSKSNTFSGTFPVDFKETNIELLSKELYHATYNCLGYRYWMIIIDEHNQYFYDRNDNIFIVDKMHFINKQNDHLKNTILDGTMVLTKIKGKETPTYIISDVICIEDNPVYLKPFNERLKIIQEEILSRRIDINNEPFGVSCKKFYNIRETKYLLSDEFKSRVPFKTDGVHFVSNKQYIHKTSTVYLKWNEIIQLKFLLKLVNINIDGKPAKEGQLYLRYVPTHFARIEYTDDIKDFDGKVISCNFVNGKWRFFGARLDKAFPNDKRTAEGVCQSIRDNITKEYLINYIQENGYKENVK